MANPFGDSPKQNPFGDKAVSQKPVGSDIVGVAEGVITAASPLTGSVVGGLGGLGAFIGEKLGFLDEGQSAEVVRAVQDYMQYEPRTQAGEQKIEAFQQSAPMQKLVEGLQAYEDFVTQYPDLIAEGQFPGFAAITKGILSGAPEMLGVAAGVPVVSRAVQSGARQIPQTGASREIGMQIAEGQTVAPTAGYRLQDPELREQSMETRQEQIIEDVPQDDVSVEITGESEFPLLEGPAEIPQAPLTRKQLRIEKFPEARKLKKQGFSDAEIAGVQQYTKDESQIAKQMARTKEAAIGNINVMEQPLTRVGNVVSDQVKVLTKAKNDAGKRVGAALDEMKDKNLNYGGVLSDWRNRLEGEGIQIEQVIGDDGIEWSADLRGSKFAGDTGAQNLLDLVVDRLALIANKEGSFGSATAKDLHDLKKLIDYRVNWSRLPGDDGLTVEAEQLAMSLRGAINDLLKQGSNKYELANADYARAITPLVKLNESTGRRVNILDDNTSPAAIGQEMRKTIGNWATTPALQDATRAVSLEARNRGYNKNINLDRLVILNGILDKRFGVSASKGGSMAGLLDPRRTNVDKAAQVAEGGLQKARGISDEQAMKDLINLFEVKSK